LFTGWLLRACGHGWWSVVVAHSSSADHVAYFFVLAWQAGEQKRTVFDTQL
jgi:hypothetical protein